MSVVRGLRTFALGLFVRAVDRVMGMPAPTSPPRTEHLAPAPILVVAPAAGFARYYPELLANEGFTAVDVLGDVDAAALDGRSVVLVGEGELRPSTVATLSAWVEEGGALVCMRPGAELADVLGLAPLGSTIDNGYLRVVTDAPPGAGIVGAPLQFHGRADCWMLDGATQVAALQATADGVTDSPAVTIRRVGDRGGCAAAFAFDLARSVALTRQGNPEWAGQNRDGDLLVRSDDLFFGAAVGDPQPDWVDSTLLAIPQADEQQRLLVNLITMMTAPSLPLPRFWYLPSGKRAVVVMTGDDHGAGGTVERFERYAALDEPGASTHAWETVRATSYVTAATSRIPWRKLIRLRRAGFEIALHVDTWNEDWTPERLRHFYAHQLAWFRNRSPFAGAPRTVRTHCVAWTDYVTQPHVELEHGIRLDTNYYAYPQSWVAGRVGHFTGSALPMRFADMDGSPIDVFQAVTQITDESAQQLPRCIEEILDAALGPNAFIAVVTVQAHTDRVESGVSDAVLAAARQRGVSVIAAQQLLTWLDARNASRVDRVAWRDGRLCFDVVGDPLAHGLQLLVPAESAAGPSIVGVAVDGVPMELTNETFKGGAYARVEARTGSYEVTYGPSAALRFTTEPVVVAAAGSVEVRWTTNVPSSSIVEHGPAATTVPACVCNELAVTDHAITLEHLAPGSIVQLRVRSEAGRDAVCWPGEGRMFEVHVPPPAVCHAGSAAFADGDCEGVVVSPERGGEIVLAPARHALDGTDAWSAGSSGPLIALDGRVTFHVGGDVQRFGLGDAGDAGAAFELTPDGRLGAVTWDGAQRSRQEIPGRWAGAAHRLRIDRETTEARFWIDGSDVALVPARIGDTAAAVVEGRVEVEWLRALPYGLRGTYTSPVLDSGDGTTWRRLAWAVVHAQTTRLDVSVRVGDDAGLSDGAAPWTAVPHSGCDLPATGRYLQYRLTLTSAQPMRTPAVQSVTIERATCSSVARLASRARTITE